MGRMLTTEGEMCCRKDLKSQQWRGVRVHNRQWEVKGQAHTHAGVTTQMLLVLVSFRHHNRKQMCACFLFKCSACVCVHMQERNSGRSDERRTIFKHDLQSWLRKT